MLPNAAARMDRSVQRDGSGPRPPAGEGVSHGIATETTILRELGLAKPLIARMAQLARDNGTTIEQELLASGGIIEDAYYEAMARLAGLTFLAEIAPGRLTDGPMLDLQLRDPTQLQLSRGNRAPLIVICPRADRLPHLTASLQRLPDLRQKLAIASPGAIRRAVWAVGAERRVQATIRGLFDERPDLSARIVLCGGQGFHLGLFCGLLFALVLIAPGLALLSLHVGVSLLFFAGMALRLVALLHPRAQPRRRALGDAPGPLPVYTVLVALYREAEVVPQLLAALERLNWPRSLLDIKLVCEADDPETIAAIERLRPGSHIEILRVPPGPPRTKPKALSYALAGARGDYVAVFDAEDRPHPDQLREAHQRFAAAPPDLACLQAPLIISNPGQSWISAVFSLEYSGLFRRLLPALARFHLPVPLGGTSNHFRTEALRRVGGWDPFNVTEDADLGMRFYRHGYRTSVLSRQTLEDAPTDIRVWLGQRTRWLKGWMQTWLVVMRSPIRACRQMGVAGFLVFQLLIGGMLLSSLAHPFLFVFVATAALSMTGKPASDVPLGEQLLLAVDLANIFGSYAGFLALGATAMIAYERRLVGWRWCAIPPYWLLISVAGWRALFELRFRPFFWQKTPHAPARGGDEGRGAARSGRWPRWRLRRTAPAGGENGGQD